MRIALSSKEADTSSHIGHNAPLRSGNNQSKSVISSVETFTASLAYFDEVGFQL